jgi:O-antigen/teichoic acid export membrane protein
MLGPDEMGGFFVALSIVMIGSTISELGLNKTVVRLVAADRARAKPGGVRDAVRLTFLIGMLSALVLGTVLALGPGQALALDLFNSQAVADAMPFVAGWMVAVTLEVLVAETFRGFKNFWAATLFGDLLIDIFAVAVFGLMWASDSEPTLSQVVQIMLALTAGSSLIGALLLSGYLRGLRGRGHHEPREVLGISLPLMVVSLSSFFVGTGVDLWVIASFEPTDQVALYGSAAKLMFLVATPFIIISQVVPPIIAQLYEQRRLKELESALRSTATLAGLPAAAVLIFMMVFGSWLLTAVYGSSFYAGAESVLVILGFARLFAVATGSCGVALTMTGHQKLMMWITMFSAVFSFGLELVLVQPFGIVGVATATLIAQVGQNSLQLYFTHREIGIWTQMEFSLRPVTELFGLSAKGART